MKDLYQILGTERNCTSGELNAAYRKLAQKLQPEGQERDHFLDAHFQEITEAYQVLSDPMRRRKYDLAYRNNYQRRLYYFKIKHINVALTLALVVFTGLFGWYVINVLNGRKAKKIVVVAPARVVTVAHKIKHHKKKHALKTPIITPANTFTAKPDTQIAVAKVKPVSAPIIPVAKHGVKTVPPPILVKIEDPDNTVNMAYLQANVTGVVNLHEHANYRSAVVASIPNNTKVQVLEKGSGFYKIIVNGQTGYVPKWTVASRNIN